ncbi:MAG: ATP-binding protein [Bacteroidota bacterium]
MIKELHLENWKSYASGKLYIDPLTILIGTNASGKSNVVDALLFLQKISRGLQLTSAVRGDQDNEGIRGNLDWLIKKGEEKATLKIIFQSSIHPSTDYEYFISIVKIDNRIEVFSEYLSRVKYTKTKKKSYSKNLFYTTEGVSELPSIAAYFATNTQGRGKKVELRKSISVLSQSVSLSLLKEVQEGINELVQTLTHIFVLDPIPSHMRNYAPLSDVLLSDASNVAGVLAALDESRKTVVEEKLTNYLRFLPEKDVVKVWVEAVGKFQSDAMLYCKERWEASQEDFIVDARGMSDGTLRFLAILTALLTIKEGSLLVVEEIDNGLHPSRADLLVKFLKEIGESRKIDIVCTTHNPALLDAFGNEMISFISLVYRNKVSGNSEIKLLENVSDLPKLLARGTIGKLATRGYLQAAI